MRIPESIFMIARDFDLSNLIREGKVLVIYGPRRVGKTTLLTDYLGKCGMKYKLGSGDDIRIKNIFGGNDLKTILEYAEGYKLIAIDEAQEIPGVGKSLKLLVDHRSDIIVLITGSSSFNIKQDVGEPLTGRKREIILLPFSQKEMLAKYNRHELKQELEDFLIFGSYPEVRLAGSREEKKEYLMEIVNSYLLKDILGYERLRAPRELLYMLTLLAFQAGSEVSLNEISSNVKLDVKTVQRYTDLLEKAFILRRLTAFSRNLRKEVSKKSKYYFLDNGIRNGIIQQFAPLKERNDTGALFENFIITERMKKNSNRREFINSYFWRTFDKKEIDYIEESDGRLKGYEFKWSGERKVKPPGAWTSGYPDAGFEVISRENYLEFIL